MRAAAPDKEILVLGYVSPDGFAEAIRNGISLTMYRPEALEALDRQAATMGQKARVHIKINSGMNRIGFAPTGENADVVARCMKLPSLEITGIFTHLATADEADKSGVRKQMARFDAFLELRGSGASPSPPSMWRPVPPSVTCRNMTGIWCALVYC